MLLRVASNISMFPAHAVSILTSTVIECVRSGLKKSAFDNASVLMHPEYHEEIDERFRKKIEGIVRKKKDFREDIDPSTSPCPVCEYDLPDYSLDCPNCKSSLACCIVSVSIFFSLVSLPFVHVSL